MNDFPIPEDPPVMMTAEKSFRAASGVGMDLVDLGSIFRGRDHHSGCVDQPKSNAQP
jgi:hypothetical protein